MHFCVFHKTRLWKLCLAQDSWQKHGSVSCKKCSDCISYIFITLYYSETSFFKDSFHGKVAVTLLPRSVLFKNFDTVNHYPLLHKLNVFSIAHAIIKWLQDFLNHVQIIAHYEASPMTHVQSGVPQRSVLQPLLFLILVVCT